MVPSYCSYDADNASLSMHMTVNQIAIMLTHLRGAEFVVAVPEVGDKLCLGEWQAIDTNPLPHL